MNIREGILDALVDGGESLKQIHEYLNYLGLKIDKKSLIAEVVTLFKQGKIYIEYPPDARNIKELDLNNIEDYWFELTQEGRSEWDNITA